MIGRSAADAKRKIGGHFGAAVGASTKRGRGAAWREEVDDVEAPAPAAEDDSESDVALDPGTPLPSESEDDKAAPSTAAEVDSAAPAQPEDASADAAAAANSAASSSEASVSSAAAQAVPNGSASSEVPPATSSAAVVITLQLVVSEKVACTARVLLRAGLGEATEKRLAACIPPAGSLLDELSKGVVCTFGGHCPVAGAAKGRRKAAKTAAQVAEAEAPAHELPDEAIIDEEAPVATPAASSSQGARGAGLLWQPLEGSGLVLSLGSTGAQLLESTHSLVGPLLTGRRMLQQLEVLAPLVGGLSPQQPVALRVLGPKPADAVALPEDDPVITHPFLLLEPAPATLLSGTNLQPFALEETQDAASALEVLEDAELEINCRDAEVAELKGMGFNRERQKGVEVVVETLQSVEHRLSKLGAPIPPEEAGPPDDGGPEKAQTHQRWWLSQRVQQLLRVLQKLR